METSLSKSQIVALDLLKSGANVFLDGLAGTGKTFLLDYYTKHYCIDSMIINMNFVDYVW